MKLVGARSWGTFDAALGAGACTMSSDFHPELHSVLVELSYASKVISVPSRSSGLVISCVRESTLNEEFARG